MQFKFLGDEPCVGLTSSVSLKILLRCQAKTEIEMFHEFQNHSDMRKIMNGIFFFAKVANPLKSVSKYSLCDILSFDVYSVNQKLLSNQLPEPWTSETPKEGFVFKTIQFRPSHFLVNDVKIWLKSDISLKKCGPLLHGCRLLDYTGRDFLYLFYNNATREFRVEELAPPPLVKMESLKTICLAAISGMTALDYSILSSDLQCSMQHHLSPSHQMASKDCYKTVKVWHPNQKLWQEIEYDVETKKYHGKALAWNSRGRLVLQLHFHQGLMHGSCVTMYSGIGGFLTSRSTFNHNAPTGKRIRLNLIKDYKKNNTISTWILYS